MEVQLENNEKLQRFIQLICDLNHESVEMIQSGNTELLYTMNDTIEEMYSIQNDSKLPEYTAVDEDCQVIYKNFNAIITMLNTNETQQADAITTGAVKKFLRNIFDANVRIIRIYGLA